MQGSIRPATAADIPAMHAIRRAVRENRLAETSAVIEASYPPFIDQQAAWVAIVDSRIAGFAALDAAGANVWALFVAPWAERLGVGRALHEQLLTGAADRSLRTLSLTTSPGTRAADFYREAGWTESETTASGELRFTRSVPDVAPPLER